MIFFDHKSIIEKQFSFGWVVLLGNIIVAGDKILVGTLSYSLAEQTMCVSILLNLELQIMLKYSVIKKNKLRYGETILLLYEIFAMLYIHKYHSKH